MASYNSSFQTTLVKQYLKNLAKNLNTNITVERIDVELFNTVVLTNLYVEDLHQDTLLFVKKLKVDIEEFSFNEKKILLEKATLNEVYFNLQKYASDSTNNMRFIIDYFTPKDTLDKKNEWLFKLNNVSIVRSKFNYDNADHKQKLAGVDYNHVSITYLNTDLNNIEFIPKGVNCDIKK